MVIYPVRIKLKLKVFGKKSEENPFTKGFSSVMPVNLLYEYRSYRGAVLSDIKVAVTCIFCGRVHCPDFVR